MMKWKSRSSQLVACLLMLPFTVGACRSLRLESSAMPVVEIRTPGGRELGVATEDGILFLGRTARSGPAKVLYFLDGAPLVEAGSIHELGASLCEVDLDVTVPDAPISFDPLEEGESLLLMGLTGVRSWSAWSRVSRNPWIEGTVLEWPPGLELRPEHVGAGAFRSTSSGLALVGFLKGTATIEGGGRFLCLAGLPEIREALMKPRSAVVSEKVRYRADGLRAVRKER